jgi:hypothetical protein
MANRRRHETFDSTQVVIAGAGTVGLWNTTTRSDSPHYERKLSSTQSSFKHLFDKWWTCWAILVVLLIALATGLHLFVLSDNQSTQSSSSSNVGRAGAPPAPTSPPFTVISVTPMPPTTMAPIGRSPVTRVSTEKPRSYPTLHPVASSAGHVINTTTVAAANSTSDKKGLENAKIAALIRNASLEPHIVWNISTSKPSLAVAWLQTQNLAPLHVDDKNDDQHALLQRYAMVLLDLALHNATTPKLSMPLTHECIWPGIVCRTVNESMDRSTSRASRSHGSSVSSSPRRDVVDIDWSGMGLTGSIPNDVHLLSHLTTLDVAHNALRGTIPAGLYRLDALQNLNLSHNALSGRLALHAGQWPQLVRLEASANRLTGSVPSSLGLPRTIANALQVPDIATLDNATFQSSSLGTKVLFLAFISSWC